MPIQVYSFFSGVGFLDLGFENAGFDIVFVNEHNERFLQAYQYARRNNNHVPLYGYSNEDVRVYLSDEKWQEAFPEYNNDRNRSKCIHTNRKNRNPRPSRSNIQIANNRNKKKRKNIQKSTNKQTPNFF